MKSTLALLLLILMETVLLAARQAPAPPEAPVVLTAATAPASLRAALAHAQTALAAPLRESLRTLPAAKKRFQAGLPQGDQLLLSVRVQATDTSFYQASGRVLGWRGTSVQALLLLPGPAGAAGPTEPRPVSFPEAAVVDWTLRRASGREEGNYLGRYLEVTRQLERLPLR